MVQGFAITRAEDHLMRDVAFELLRRVEEDDSYANLLLPKLLQGAGVDSRDAGFIQELSFGAIRFRLFYERVIEAASGRQIKAIETNALLVLVLGAHQLLGMRVPVHAAINESVNLAKKKASKSAVGFVNAVLRNIAAKSRDEWVRSLVTKEMTADESLSLEHSHPAWIVKALRAALEVRSLQASLEQLLVANNVPARVAVAALPGFSEVSELLEYGDRGSASPISVELNTNPSLVPQVQQGYARVQDQGSQLAVLALLGADIHCDDSAWLDLCAGPGGKAALMAAIAGKKNIRFTANEISVHRAKLVQQGLAPISSAKVTIGDGRVIGESGSRFSRILIDAPCTGLGALRRRPEARWRKDSSDLAALSKLQKALFIGGWDALLSGGVLAYVTCSPHLSETSALVSWAEAKYGDSLELLSANKILNLVNPMLRLNEGFLTAQLWPHLNGTDAMFIAIFRKSINS